MSDSLPYRAGVGVMLLNQNRDVFVAKRLDMLSEAWQMPQGGIDENEAPQEAVFRELEEEIGTNKAVILRESSEWLTYDLPDELVPKIWGGRYRGQRQKWYAMRFLGEDKDIDIRTEHPEFSEWRWIDMPRLPELIVPFKRPLYQRLVEEFGDIVL